MQSAGFLFFPFLLNFTKFCWKLCMVNWIVLLLVLFCLFLFCCCIFGCNIFFLCFVTRMFVPPPMNKVLCKSAPECLSFGELIPCLSASVNKYNHSSSSSWVSWRSQEDSGVLRCETGGECSALTSLFLWTKQWLLTLLSTTRERQPKIF